MQSRKESSSDVKLVRERTSVSKLPGCTTRGADTTTLGMHLGGEILKVSLSAQVVMQRLPAVLTSLGPADVDLSVPWQITATVFQDYAPHDIQINVSDNTLTDEATIQLCEPRTSDPPRFYFVVRTIAMALCADTKFPPQPQLFDDTWSDEEEDFEQGSMWREQIEEVVKEVLTPGTNVSTIEELIQILASWSDRSVTAQTELAKVLSTSLGFFFSKFVLHNLQSLPCSSVRPLFPFALMMKNAAASPAGRELQPLTSMIEHVVTKQAVGSLARHELHEALVYLRSFAD
eukprot:TRINITY_DN109643_c0_g1_i1.p1 TRINITY_DN109643_c0_g1~~TRINITY_DN109643_c0_g1_i1.p1  ORF type:complete len:289 (+),score=54.10 TRINITY_DN109643_c0_g1_i1:105-971(+)